jgi:hypothetical protein
MVFRSAYKEYASSYHETFNKVNDYVKSACWLSGIVYGDYVINIITNKKSIYEADFNILNIWFTTQENADAFVNDNKLELIGTEMKYSVQRNYYIGHKLIKIEVIICDFYPVCDFTVNLISWNGKKLELNKPYNVLKPSETLTVIYSFDHIMHEIKYRHCHILPPFRSLGQNCEQTKNYIHEFGKHFKFFNY